MYRASNAHPVGAASTAEWGMSEEPGRDTEPSVITRFSRALVEASGILVVLLLAVTALEASLPIERDFNEGWNTYQAQRFYEGEPLYPAQPTPVVNNYPPLSFMLIGGLARGTGETAYTGRAVAGAAFLAVLFLLWRVGLKLTGGSGWSAVAPVLFGFMMLAHHRIFVGLNDPQMLAHAIMLIGFWMVLRNPTSKQTLFLSAIVVVAAGFTKHNLIPLPIAMLALLWSRNSASAWKWGAAVLAASIAGVALCTAVFGAPFFQSVFLFPRGYAGSSILWKAPIYLKPWVLIIGYATFVCATMRKVAEVRALSIYFGLSAIWGILILGGSGIDANAFFDLFLASALISAVGVASLARAPRHEWHMIAAVCIVLVSGFWGTRRRLGDAFALVQQRQADTTLAEDDIRTVRSIDGPVLCESLLLCYWAGKPFEADFFTSGQRLRQPGAQGRWLLDGLKEQRFKAVQLANPEGDGYSDRMPAAFWTALHTHYRVDRVSRLNGTLLLAKTRPTTGTKALNAARKVRPTVVGPSAEP